MITSGYSSTPLVGKLGFNKGFYCLLYKEPKHYFELLNDMPADLMGLVDIKVAAIDEDWSGLKFVYRLKDRN